MPKTGYSSIPAVAMGDGFPQPTGRNTVMHRNPGARARTSEPGFSLVEVVLALGVGVFALMLLVAVIPTGIQVNRDSREEYQAMELLRQISFDLKDGGVTSGESRFDIPQLHNPGGTTDAETYPEPAGMVLLNAGFQAVEAGNEPFYQLSWQVHPPDVTGLGRAWLHLRLEWPVGTGSTRGDGIETGFLLGDAP